MMSPTRPVESMMKSTLSSWTSLDPGVCVNTASEPFGPGSTCPISPGRLR
jgi:hypothetical protein